ncbi:MAG TPA: metalloregulator ArsR/SmtB family transcription factor [Marmoricola sp.]|nr:metalloregulator ArsR/SmtB family transcription factor [Marmoricola sp.]
MADHAAKHALFDGLVVAAKALANGRRAEIVDVLSQGERSVEEIAAEIDQSAANTSQHLQQLHRAGLVATRRDGNRVYYHLADPRVGELWALLRDVTAERHAEVERLAANYLGDRDLLTTITRAELDRRLGRRNVVVVDVRPAAEYAAGHIAGAISMPIDQLSRSSFDIPRGAEIVAYCRGPYCVYADDAVRALTRKGLRAVRLEDGYPEWARAGLPTAVGASAAGS